MSEQTASNVPQIRFRGFSGAWAEKKIQEMFRVTRGNVLAATKTSPKQTKETPYPVYSSQTKHNGLMGYYKSHLFEDAITWTTDGANAGTVCYREGKFYSTNVNGVLLSERGYANRAVSESLNQEAWKHVSHVGNPKLMNNVMSQIRISVPDTIAEQTQIGEYFRELDRLIGLHQRKHDKLVTLKKAMLQKMFPQPGATTPEIRFKGYSEDWVEKKLGDIIELGSGRDYKHLTPGNIPVYGTGGYMLSVNEALSNGIDAVGIGRKGTIDKPYILKAPFWTVDTLFYAIPKADNHLDFVYCIFQLIDWKQKDESTGVPSLSKVAINGVSVLSANSPEQQKIGTYFRTLDVLISKHATQLQKLKQIKSACLEKMFV